MKNAIGAITCDGVCAAVNNSESRLLIRSYLPDVTFGVNRLVSGAHMSLATSEFERPAALASLIKR